MYVNFSAVCVHSNLGIVLWKDWDLGIKSRDINMLGCLNAQSDRFEMQGVLRRLDTWNNLC